MLHALALVVALGAVPSPEITVVTTNDAVPNAVAAHKGKVVLLKFWATWCDTCVAQFPKFVALANQRKDLAIVSVSVDLKQAIDKSVRPFLKKQRATFPSLLLDVEAPEQVMKLIDPKWDGSLPATFVYRRDGVLEKSYIGKTPGLDALLDKLLAQ